jgi:hypothetical protein
MAIHDQRFRNGIAGFLAGWRWAVVSPSGAANSGTTFAAVQPVIETIAVLVVGLTGHLGGFLSGVNGPG